MAQHQYDENARELWNYFESVMSWIEHLFPTYQKKYMKGLPWGVYYNQYKENNYNLEELSKQVELLIDDEEVTNKKGIYEYLLSNKTKEACLNIRNFPDDIKKEVFKKQQGICPKCNKTFKFEEMDGDHIKPWSQGGKTIVENCQMLCKDCNRRKSNK